MARRFGSAMISNTDSTSLIYSTEHMRVKAYKGPGGRPQIVCAALFNSEWSKRQGFKCRWGNPGREVYVIITVT
jgi:hypothetical protein